jgi:hypothetical protein
VGEWSFDDHERNMVGSLIMINTITDNKMVSMKYLAVALFFDDFLLTVAFLYGFLSLFQRPLPRQLNNSNSFWDLYSTLLLNLANF